MSAETPRTYVKNQVKALLPTSWVYKDGDLPDTVQKVTVTQFLTSAVFTPEAPLSGSLDVEFDLIVQVPQQLSMAPIEDALLDLLFALREVDNLRVTRAERSPVIPGAFTVPVTVTVTP
jgi:hypothetical protein